MMVVEARWQHRWRGRHTATNQVVCVGVWISTGLPCMCI